ncbi:hypothetical protein E2C01_093459 [Portunus trituberculatus]|uniref:Uncharacterized protein n=1 Tax=Portunus trituberculatus TaxID=210409 RepID=A0A5B7JYB9_PORTR|nr:hypothetical protein [Portunus trituberculatus]
MCEAEALNGGSEERTGDPSRDCFAIASSLATVHSPTESSTSFSPLSPSPYLQLNHNSHSSTARRAGESSKAGRDTVGRRVGLQEARKHL